MTKIVAIPKITQSELKSILEYNHITGVFLRKVKRGNMNIGSVAGTKHSEGYWIISIDKIPYYAHRLAWFYYYGIWPLNQIDHKDGNRLNNCIYNLRDVTPSVNQQNHTKCSKFHSTGLLGSVFHKRSSKYIANISINGKQKYIGSYKTAIEAHIAYMEERNNLERIC